jgi:hypothetical protein
MHNLAKKFKKREAKISEGMCQFRSSPKEIEYFDENRVIIFLEFFVRKIIFIQFLLCIV